MGCCFPRDEAPVTYAPHSRNSRLDRLKMKGGETESRPPAETRRSPPSCSPGARALVISSARYAASLRFADGFPVLPAPGSRSAAVLCCGSNNGPGPAQSPALRDAAHKGSFSAVLPFSAPAHHLPAHLSAPAPQAGRGDCLDAHRACGSDPRCAALYRGVELCADDAPLGEQAASECLEGQDALLARHPPLLACRCQRGSRREERCLHVYWSVRLLPGERAGGGGEGGSETGGRRDPPRPAGEDEMEVSPYEMMPMDTHMASLIAASSSSSLPQDGLNPCLKAAQDCGLFEKCGALRSEYVLACTKRPSGTDRCNRQKCHRALRRFLERVPEEYSLGVLFCPCGEPLCGERRRKTIVPSCSYLERDGPPPNCLHLQSYCRRDDLCRSRLADFLHSCQASSTSSSGCVRDTSAGLCLRAYAGLIGTMMTPNYVSNSSADVALWCNCEGSGNQWQDCLRLQRMFTHNPCLMSSPPHPTPPRATTPASVSTTLPPPRATTPASVSSPPHPTPSRATTPASVSSPPHPVPAGHNPCLSEYTPPPRPRGPQPLPHEYPPPPTATTSARSMVLLPLQNPLPHSNLNTPLSYSGPFSQRKPRRAETSRS
ncbi:unnamed protein product [Arctogadus glacialis]